MYLSDGIITLKMQLIRDAGLAAPNQVRQGRGETNHDPSLLFAAYNGGPLPGHRE
ncbi:MAG: hypothetical protein MZV70_43750 [Desulfobacterales bacterium]|nr:hypothetical protein [Desulfobacterales bacterium]